jgi:hypothetical protein
VNLSTYIWTALGDGQTWDDASNWQLAGSSPIIQQPTIPTPNSDIIFPPITTLPAGSSTTINFDFAYIDMPLNSLTIEGAYTFKGNAVKIDSSLSVDSPFSTTPAGMTATILLSGLELAPGALINTASGSTLQLASASDATGLELTILGAVNKWGGGQLVVDTQSVRYSNAAVLQPIPVSIGAGSITLGASLNLGGLSFQINTGAGLVIADNVAAKVQSLTGTGLVDLAGTTAAGDLTSLTVAVPNATTDPFNGQISGTGQFVMGGAGTLTTGSIDFSGDGSIAVLGGTLDVDGSISAATLTVGSSATLGGLGTWSFSGAVVFQSGATFDVTLDGTNPGAQYTRLVDTNATSGVNLGYSSLTATVDYEYEQGDQYAIISSPLIQNAFQNVVAGRVVVNGGIILGVSPTSAAVTLSALQSVTTTGLQCSANPTHPGVPVTFTASVSTRTAPVPSGTVSFVQGTTVLATVPVMGGSASLTIASLPLGSTAITAVYAGAGGNLNSTSPTVTVAVVPYTTATSLASSPNPSILGRPVTLTASVVTTTGVAVTAGSVSFRRGGVLLGTVPLTNAGTAILTVASLAVGKTGILAAYTGTADDLQSVSPVVRQKIAAAPTVTSLSVTTQALPNGRVRYILVATVAADGDPSLTPSGMVDFRMNGKSIGTARLKGGVATRVAHGKSAGSRAKFVASFEKNTRFRASRSGPFLVPL